MKAQVSKRIARKHRNVFLRADFADLGGYEQVGHALRQLVRDGRLVKMGSGLYARARPSMLDGTPTPVRGLRGLAAEALRRLGIRTAPTRLEQDYSTGKTTQVPSGRRVAVSRRVRRKIAYNGVIMSFERARRSLGGPRQITAAIRSDPPDRARVIVRSWRTARSQAPDEPCSLTVNGIR
jgi:hypothetical protein